MTLQEYTGQWWDDAFSALFALDVPYIMEWAVMDRKNQMWLIRPDGTHTETWDYFNRLLTHAGGTLGE